MPNLNRKEKQFIDSIKFKIQNYNIPVKLKTLLRGMTGTFLHTVYNDDSEEIVDPFIELELIKNSFAYFLDKYTRVDVPGLGTIKMEPYYFQMEMAKEINNYRKVVLDKTRQAGISTIFSLYAFWKAHFFPAEMIDVVSIKQLKAQAFVKKMYPTMESLPNWMKTPVKAQNQQKIIFQHPNGSTSEILSESQSENAGRGDSLSCLILDEAAFYQSERMIRGIVASAQPTLNKTGGQMILVSCVTKDTYIYTDKGLQQVEDYIPKNCKLGFNNIQEFKIDGINHKQSTNTFYDSGITPTKKIYLQNGNMNEISEIHPFYIIDKTSPFPYFKQSKDIKVGEYSLASCREKTFGNNDEFNFNYAFKSHRDKYNIKNFKNIITEDMAYFFGLLLGDGYINFKRQYCIITANDIETQNWLLNNSHFNCKKELRRDDEIHFRLQGKYLITLLKELGFTKEKAKNKSIPKRLLQMSKKNISALLRGLFDSDGHSRTRDGSVGFTSTSKELLKQVKLLLDMFGIQVSDERWNMINPEKSTRVNGESFVGQITLSAYFSKVFYEKIGFNIKRKQEKYEIVKHLKFSNSQSYPDMKIWIKYNLINKHVDAKLQQKLAKGIRKGWTPPARILRNDNKNKITRHNIKKILDYYDGVLNHTEEYQKLLDFYNKNWYLLKVKKIENGKNHTYDFTIPETRSFYINSVIGSNTPNGVAGRGAYYYEQVIAARSGQVSTKYLEIDWWEIPDDPRIQGPKKGYNDLVNKAISEGYYYRPDIKQKYKKIFDPIAKDKYQENEWLSKSIRDLGLTTYKQEVLHEFIVSGDKVFNEHILDKVESELKEPKFKDSFKSEQINGLWIWKEPVPNHRYLFGCLPPGEKVLTNSGLKDIDKINFSDKLLSKNGEYINIKNIQEYDCDEDIYKFKIEGILRQTSFTGEHPLMVSKHRLKRKHGESRYIDYDFKFTNVRDVKKGDWLIYPNVYRKNILNEEEINFQWKKYKSERKDFDLNSNIILDEDFWWFIGIWLAEGWTQSRGFSKTIHTCHNIKTERSYTKRIRDFFYRYNRKVSFIEKESVIETVFTSSQLFKFINENFKKYADKKEIPEWVKRLPDIYKIKLIEGYLNGDGSIFVSLRKKYTTSFVSISQNLIEGIQDILFSLGFVSTLQILRREGIRKWENGKKSKIKETYQLTMNNDYSIKLMKLLNIDYEKSYENKFRRKISINHFSNDLEYIYLRIKEISINHYKGKVYNFETEDHTYLCNYLTTHNCDVASGTGNDYSTIQIIDVEEYEQVAEYKGHISTPNFVRVLRKLGFYYNEAYIIIEANSIGEAVFNGLYYNENEPYNNMYKQKKTKNGITRQTGWITDTKTRKLIVNDFIDWIIVDALWETIKIYSRRLWLEMHTWMWKENGKAEHSDGCVSGDTIITCKNGFKKIKDVKVGDEVLTHTGKFREVYKTHKFKDPNKKMLKVKSWGSEDLNITSNQKFYINDGTFKNFDDIYDYKSLKSNSIYSDKVENLEKEYDDLYLFFIGHLLSDGTISEKNKITITSENKESVLIFQKYKDYFEGKVQKCYIGEYPNENFKRFTIKDEKLYNNLKDIGVSIHKDITEEFRYISPEKQMNILHGYFFGDGSYNNNRTGCISANSISLHISYFIASILYRNRISFNISHTKVHRYERKNNDYWRISILGKECNKLFDNKFEDIFSLKNNYILTKDFIKNKEQKKTTKLRNYNKNFLQSSFSKVQRQDWDDYYYDLSVSVDHSYVANGYVVHNSNDDLIMSFAIGMYNRNKAVASGESFIINDEGEVIAYDKNDKQEAYEKRNDFEFVSNEITKDDEDDDFFQEEYGVSKDDYDWLLQ